MLQNTEPSFSDIAVHDVFAIFSVFIKFDQFLLFLTWLFNNSKNSGHQGDCKYNIYFLKE